MLLHAYNVRFWFKTCHLNPSFLLEWKKTKTSQLGFELARRILLKSRFYARVLENKSETPQKTKRLVEVIVNCCNTLIR